MAQGKLHCRSAEIPKFPMAEVVNDRRQVFAVLLLLRCPVQLAKIWMPSACTA